MRTWVKTDVSSEPVTVAEVKNFCKINTSSDDTLIATLITSCRKALENYTGKAFGSQVVYTSLTLEELNRRINENMEGGLILPRQPVSSVDSVKVIDYEGGETSLVKNTDYYIWGLPWGKLIFCNIGGSKKNEVLIEYTVGYGATGCPSLPADLKVALLREILDAYDKRENITDENWTEISGGTKKLVAPYMERRWL